MASVDDATIDDICNNNSHLTALNEKVKYTLKKSKITRTYSTACDIRKQFKKLLEKIRERKTSRQVSQSGKRELDDWSQKMETKIRDVEKNILDTYKKLEAELEAVNPDPDFDYDPAVVQKLKSLGTSKRRNGRKRRRTKRRRSSTKRSRSKRMRSSTKRRRSSTKRKRSRSKRRRSSTRTKARR